MMPRFMATAALLLALVTAAGIASAQTPATADAVQTYMAKSDRYLHHSKLQRGMTGYGLTVMAGTKLEKFDVTVLSVMKNFGPKQDVILCQLKGLDLDKSGIIAGMSGSPVYIKDPADGKFKMIGAVAYGWKMQKDPICGVQPIAQMLSLEDGPVLGRGGSGLAGAASQPTSKPSQAGALPRADDGFLKAALSPKKIDFSTLGWPKAPKAAAEDSLSPQLTPLATPIMMSGLSPAGLRRTKELFADTGLVPLQAGTAGSADAADDDGQLVPGSAVAVPLVTGDSDIAAVGTVTDVVGDYVLAFGHGFNAEGSVDMPMGPAYVHTVIASVMSSFKLGSLSRKGVTGALLADQNTGIGGRMGAKAPTVDMNLTVNWPNGRQKYHFSVVRHRRFTPLLARSVLEEAVLSNHDLPEMHSVKYSVDVQFDKLGGYRAENLSSGCHLTDVVSDLSRPLFALMNCPLDQPAMPKSIDIAIDISPEQKTADILAVELDRHSYKPGQTVKGRVTLRPFRAEKVTKDFTLQLPEKLPDGKYELSVVNSLGQLSAVRREAPHKFSPRSTEQLLDMVKEVVGPKTSTLYVRLPLQDEGLAVRKTELEAMPASMKRILTKADPVDTDGFTRSSVLEVPTEYVLEGSASASLTVEKNPQREN